MGRLWSARRAREQPPPQDADTRWFWDHYEQAAGEIAAFCADAGIELRDRTIADIGCGDGIMALGLCQRVQPERLVGFDVNPTVRELLLERARRYGVGSELPAALEFRTSTPTHSPAAEAEFDFVYSWSAFEHIEAPMDVLREIRRILRPDGHFFLQLWPFHRSAKGSHLWDWFPDDFHHLRANERDVVAEMRLSDRHSAEWTEYMAGEFERLNRITLDELQRSVLAAGFDVRFLELLSTRVHLTPDLGRYRWTDLAVGGIKLIAVPAR